jgi:hypothetical protein
VNKQLVFTIIATIFVSSCLIGAAVLRPERPPVETIWGFPNYPRAGNLGRAEKAPDKGSSIDKAQYLFFDTLDSSPAVYDYYKAWFLGNGWQFEGVSSPSQMHFFTKERNAYGGLALTSFSGPFSAVPWIRVRTIHIKYRVRIAIEPHLNSCVVNMNSTKSANGVCISLSEASDFR